MLAKKLNRVYTIDESEKDKYLKNGFDIVDEKGKVVEHAETKTITFAAHNKEVAELKAQIEELNSALEKANAVPKNAKELKVANEELTKTNEELVAKVAELEAQVEALTKDGEDDGKVQE